MSAEEVTPEQPSKLSQIKTFVKAERKTIIACTVTGAVVFTVTRAFWADKFAALQFSTACTNSEYAELYEELGGVMDFVDHKNLREKYFAFVTEQNG